MGIPSGGNFFLFYMLVGAHCIGDFGLQSDWMATNKNRHVRDRYTNEERTKLQIIWPHLLFAHCMIHGFLVTLVTQNLWAGLAEIAVHAATDFAKCEGWFGFHTDQAIHVAAKLVWVLAISQGWF